MPHPKNRIKLTGDTRMPGRDMDLDLDLDLGLEEDDAGTAHKRGSTDLPARVYADGYVPPSGVLLVEEIEIEPVLLDMQPDDDTGMKEKVEQKVGPKAARRPWIAIGSAIAVGFVVMRMLRH